MVLTNSSGLYGIWVNTRKIDPALSETGQDTQVSRALKAGGPHSLRSIYELLGTVSGAAIDELRLSYHNGVYITINTVPLVW